MSYIRLSGLQISEGNFFYKIAFFYLSRKTNDECPSERPKYMFQRYNQNICSSGP